MKINTVGSICSGIEAASVAWTSLGASFSWFSEIASFPSQVLKNKFPDICNLGDMNKIPDLILQRKIAAPDLICGGTPCQAFSYAGNQLGLNDDRGNLTLKFVDIIKANDKIRKEDGKEPCTIFWENVEGVLCDKTNAFGCLISSLAGLRKVYQMDRWPSAGLLEGPKRNVAWRVLDAKHFGLPQQRKRLYLLATGKDYHPESILFEFHTKKLSSYPDLPLTAEKNGHSFEVFRQYSDCLYSAYGTKWNGNAAAYNGSLFVVQDNRIRRLSPLECERLMGFPDNYTNISKATRTNRYQALGNSWAVPVVKWIGSRFINHSGEDIILSQHKKNISNRITKISKASCFYNLGRDIIEIADNKTINCTCQPENSNYKSLVEILSDDAPDTIYISPVGCHGIIRRKNERNLSINTRLEEVLHSISSQMDADEIEKKSRIQKRGKYSQVL